MNALKILSRHCNLPLKLFKQNIQKSFRVRISFSSETYNTQFNLNEDDNFYSKIIYNEILVNVPVKKKIDHRPIFLKFLTEKKTSVPKNKTDTESEIVSFPFEIRNEFLTEIDTKDEATENEAKFFDKNQNKEGEWRAQKYRIDKGNLEDPKKWNITSLMDDKIDDLIQFGSCDTSVPISKIPCGGCGAFFHCKDTSVPGFLPKEILVISNREELRSQICQRCHFLRTFNVALGVNVPAFQYEQVISKIRDKVGLVIFMVDLLDFPCSIYPEVFNLIGPSKPLVVVGNKVDLLMQEDSLSLNNFKESLLCSLRKIKFNVNNIKHVALISAKTGYGIEDLITTLQNCWANEGDVYLVGCANVGKSSLFNILLQSDYCKVNAADILQRATVSAWPGTTLNLLKFPIAKILKWRLAARQNRLLKEEEQKLELQRLQYSGQNIKLQQVPLAEHVGRTFQNAKNSGNSSQSNNKEDNINNKKGIDPRTPEFAFSKWFYDTPGVLHNDQILNFLTTSELLLTLPTKILIPRNFQLKEGHSIFIGGIARLDYISGPKFVWFTVFASSNLPITVTKSEDADLVYKKLLGSPLFCVPSGGKARLAKWPDLGSKKIEICGKAKEGPSPHNNSSKVKEADVDVVLSSAGWVSVNVLPPYRCIVEAWTPEGRGIRVRQVPLIKKGHVFRGERILKTPAYKSTVEQAPEYTAMSEASF